VTAYVTVAREPLRPLGLDNYAMDGKRHFVCFFWLTGPYIQLGFHFDPISPNIEIHVPFGFFKVGWTKYPPRVEQK
jgi:hypothetical protein